MTEGRVDAVEARRWIKFPILFLSSTTHITFTAPNISTRISSDI